MNSQVLVLRAHQAHIGGHSFSEIAMHLSIALRSLEILHLQKFDQLRFTRSSRHVSVRSMVAQHPKHQHPPSQVPISSNSTQGVSRVV